MQHVAIKHAFANSKLLEQTVTLCGWVKTRRDSKAGISFIQLSDGSCFDPLQVVAAESLANYRDEITKLTSGCAIKATGRLVQSQGKGQSVELQADSIEVVGWVEQPETYPIQPKRHSLEFLREVAHLRPRTNTIAAITRLRHRVAMAIHQFFHQNDFFWVNTPLITASDCEGAGELFRVSTLDLVNIPKKNDGSIDYQQDFFEQAAFLTVSGQLNAEAYCLAMSKVYTFGPTFRAENSNTSRHLAEFWMVEPEIAFADLNDNALLAENLLKFICQAVLDDCEDDLAFFNQWIDKTVVDRLNQIVTTPFERMDYREAIQILEKAKQPFEFPVGFGHDLHAEHERYLTETVLKKPVIMQNYPKQVKSFYMRLNDDGETVAAMDVLVPGMGEIIGGSQREERLAVLDTRIEEMGLDKNDHNWYRDLRRYGSVPHAGFGLGFERMLSYISGLSNVRDVIPFPRTPGHVAF